jgi:hypothetical protein
MNLDASVRVRSLPPDVLEGAERLARARVNFAALNGRHFPTWADLSRPEQERAIQEALPWYRAARHDGLMA